MADLYLDEPVVLDKTAKSIAQELRAIRNVLAKGAPTIYAFHIDGAEGDPSEKVSYLEDSIGMIPAGMDYTNDKFSYGSWKDAFFMPRPCMLKYDGTVDYYLDSDDYTKKEDGTASDIADTSYEGNAMMEFPHIWLKIVPDDGDDTSGSVYISNMQVDDDYHDWSNHNSLGAVVEHFYTSIYNGSLIDGKLRSLSGQQVSKSLTGTQEITYAKANNLTDDEIWNIECYADRLLITALLVLLGKSTDTQKVFGQGLNAGGSEVINDAFRTGQQNTKGLFYGTNSGAASTYSNAIKALGMENLWGFQWRRHNGYLLVNDIQKTKMCYGTEDGSTVSGYNVDGSGYISIPNSTPTGISENYISEMLFSSRGIFPKTISGSSTTYYCDGIWFNNVGIFFVLFGGTSYGGAKVGVFCAALSVDVSSASWTRGAALSCKPLT